MKNIPDVKTGIAAVSRDCFPIELSGGRRKKVAGYCKNNNIPLTEIQTIIENEGNIENALAEIRDKKVNALVVYLGNFGPEGPATKLAEKFSGPIMFAAAAEESGDNLIHGRGDAYCGLLNASYNIGLRGLNPYIPDYPVGTPEEIAQMIDEFQPIARVCLGLKRLKIFSFGPRPHDFLACNAPIKPLYDIGVEVMENSELDLLDICNSAEGDPAIEEIAQDMAKELGGGNAYPDLLKKLAQYELGLIRFMEDNLGVSEYGVFANKCWPAFEKYFTFVPCYVNSRFASRGIPIACETDIYGALSEYIITCATSGTAALLDINNTVPPDMIKDRQEINSNYKPTDLFMGFHCGNTASGCLVDPQMKYQLIMHRLMEPDKEPEITRGTLEGRIKPGEITIFRLQSTADTELKAYAAEGEILDLEPKTFGGTGVFAIKEMGRFYRHVLIEKRFPHHTAVGFKHSGKVLFNAMRMLGVEDLSYNQPQGSLYKTENPF
ncbi:L-fucose/L-arabinose isomerase family protein [candidate division KSB1 bacterium]